MTVERLIMKNTAYSVAYGTLSTRIDVTEWTYDANGKVVDLRQMRTVYVHRSEYRTWDA
jgi:hypothetical protein